MVRIPNKSKSRVRTALIFSANKVMLWGYHLQVRSDGNSELKKVPLETDPRAALSSLSGVGRRFTANRYRRLHSTHLSNDLSPLSL